MRSEGNAAYCKHMAQAEGLIGRQALEIALRELGNRFGSRPGAMVTRNRAGKKSRFFGAVRRVLPSSTRAKRVRRFACHEATGPARPVRVREAAGVVGAAKAVAAWAGIALGRGRLDSAFAPSVGRGSLTR